MLNWWRGRPVEGKCPQDDDPEHEQPETPAPVFAARALKSALFGTPAPPDDTIYNFEDQEDEVGTSIAQAPEMNPPNLSPTKPPGILLTPGTAAMRRKTVSFGNEVVDKHNEKKELLKTASKSGIPDDCPGKFPSPFVSVEGSSRRARKTPLTRTLENAREGKAPRPASESTRTSFELDPFSKDSSERTSDVFGKKYQIKESLLLQPTTRNTDKHLQQHTKGGLPEATSTGVSDGDATMDVNEPYSRSGKFWKSEYDQYHEEAKMQMERLFKYKVLAKGYAKMKDDEALALTEKLKEEQRKVIRMENKVSQLSAKMASLGPDGADKSPERAKQLARQTALALQYKTEVEELRTTMENCGRPPSASKNHHRRTSSSLKTDTNVEDELNRARKELKELDTLREEVKQLGESLMLSEGENAKLRDENTKLTQELLDADLRHKNHVEQCDKKRYSADGHIQKKEERFQNLQRDYDKSRELLKKVQRDSDVLLQSRQDQIISLRMEIASLRNADRASKKLQRGSHNAPSAQEEVVEHFEKQSKSFQRFREQGSLHAQDTQGITKTEDIVSATTNETAKGPLSNETSLDREGQIPVLTSISRRSKIMAPSESMDLGTFTSHKPQSSHRALSEIVNGASADTIPPEGLGPVQHTPLPFQATPPHFNRYSRMSPESPELRLPSPEPSPPLYKSSRAIHERNCHVSPRPSMFNIASSPPKADFVRSRTSELTKQRSNNNLGAQRSALTPRKESSRPRRDMDPDRIAAAKARLEEKKRLKVSEAQKENVS